MKSVIPGPLFIASDHAGFSLKEQICSWLASENITVTDLGPSDASRCDYPDFAHALCRSVVATHGTGILICGTGLGMSMAANRHKDIRAAVCTHEFHAQATREHNNANVICLGERVTAPGLATELVRIFLTTEFSGGRHSDRIAKIDRC